jgi:hypothetical protein
MHECGCLHPKTLKFVTFGNSLVDGHKPSHHEWNRLDFSRAWIDPGPSPAGNEGPYLHVPTNEENEMDQTVHRIYPR